MTIASPRWRAYSDENCIRLSHRVLEIEIEIKSSGRDVACHELVKSGLVNRDLPVLKGENLSSILIYACDLMTKISEAGAGNQSDVARSNHYDAHGFPTG